MANNGRTYASHVYWKNTVKLEINECKENQFIWCPNCTRITNSVKETAVTVSKIIRFNKGGIMVRA